MNDRNDIATICARCKHIQKPSGLFYEPHPEPICLNSWFLYRDYVTGGFIHPLCKDRNRFGCCDGYEESNNSTFP